MNKILIVDDEYVIRSLLETVFEGYDYVTAENGDDAMLKVKEHKPKLVILDLMMPKKSGYQVLREIKENPELKDMYVIVLTAKHQVSDVNLAVDIDADEFMTKPFDPAKLKSRVDLVLECLDCGQKIQPLFKEWSGSIHYVKGR